MIVSNARASRYRKLVSLATGTAFIAMLVIPPTATGQPTTSVDREEAVYQQFQEIQNLRADGEYDLAIEQLTKIIEDYSDFDRVLREAYNQLVTTYRGKGDMEGFEQAARRALERFPDLTADKLHFPKAINAQYDSLRKEMFGSLKIDEPKGCRVFLDSLHVGETPLDLPLVKVGEYDLVLTKSGYNDYKERISIQPDHSLEKDVPMDRKRGPKWWIIRVGAGVVAVALLAVGLSGGDEGSEEPPPEPLPNPPNPPTN